MRLMFLFYSNPLILVTSAAWAAKNDPVIQQVGKNTFMGFPSEWLFVLNVLGSSIVIIWTLLRYIFGTEQKKLNDLSVKMDQVLAITTEMKTKVQHLENDKVTDAEVKDLARKEVQHFFEMMDRMKKL